MSSTVILIKDGTVVNSESTTVTDVLLENGKITAIEREMSPPPCCEVINARGMYVIPGGIDMNTQLEVESNGMKPKDDFYHGTRAGVAGGTTMVVDLLLRHPRESILEKFLEAKEKADRKAVCDYALHVGITSWDPHVASDMEKLVSNYGVSSFKVHMAGQYALNDSQLYQIFKKCGELGVMPVVYAENGHIINEKVKELQENGVIGPEAHWLSRPDCVEAEASNRACMIAANAGSSIYLSSVMSSAAATAVSSWQKSSGQRVYGEVITAALGTTYSPEFSPMKAANYVTSPPISPFKKTPEELMMRLSQGHMWTTGSANCAFDREQKQSGWNDFTEIPTGVSGLEDRLSVVWDHGVESGILSSQQFVSVTSTNAAKILGFYPRKGSISIGADADVVVWNSLSERIISASSHHHKSDFNILEGLKVRGNPEIVIVKGKCCYRNGELSTIKGWGNFVPMQPSLSNAKGRSGQELTSVTHQLAAYEDTSNSPVQGQYCQLTCERGAREVNADGISVFFVEPKSLNFQEKRWAMEAMRKMCARVNTAVVNIFKEYDKDCSQTISKGDFVTVVTKLCGISTLSNREVDAVVKGYSKQGDDAMMYIDFLRSCEHLFRTKGFHR